MSCPPTIAEAIALILGRGLLRIRAAAWAGDAERCVWESDHLHNLPSLLSRYSPDLLRYYWEVERAAFLECAGKAGVEVKEFDPAWTLMDRQLEAAA